jgi:hypothetical protein
LAGPLDKSSETLLDAEQRPLEAGPEPDMSDEPDKFDEACWRPVLAL